MSVTDVLTILAVLVSPLIAIQVDKWLERRREARSRKLSVFRALMTTRAAPVSATHVEALNMIDIEFSGGSLTERAVVDAWKLYRDHLSTPTADTAAWNQRVEDLIVELLFAMSRDLGYQFDRVAIKRGVYSPQAHGEELRYTRKLRQFMEEVADGKRGLPVEPMGQTEASPTTLAEVFAKRFVPKR